MDLGAFELQIFVSLIVVLGAAFVALVCDYLKGSNEQLREHNIELRVRKNEQERRGILDPPRWLEQLVNTIQNKAQPTADIGPQTRTASAEQSEALNSWASRQDPERPTQRGASMSTRRWREHRTAVEDSSEHRSPLENWVNPETMARVASKVDQESGERADYAETQAAVAESKADIRDEIQKLVGASPRSRRGKPEPGAGSMSSSGRDAAANPATVESRQAPVYAETAVAMDPDHETPAATERRLGGHEEAAVPDLGPSLGLDKEMERVAQTHHRFSVSAHPAGVQGIAQIPLVQVTPLKLEEELRRVAETSAAETDSRQSVSALLDQVIAVSSHHSRREPKPELKRESAVPVVTAASRSLLDVQVVEAHHEFTAGDSPERLGAIETVVVVVPVQTVEEV